MVSVTAEELIEFYFPTMVDALRFTRATWNQFKQAIDEAFERTVEVVVSRPEEVQNAK